MQVTRPEVQNAQRRGFTLIELLVVIAIIATLAALLLSAIQSAREASRRNQCMSHMRNVSTAMQTYATNSKGALPYLISDPNRLTIWTGGTPNTPSLTTSPAPWSVALLPYLEYQGLYDHLVKPGSGPESITQLQSTGIQVYTCPDDPNSDAVGTLSFVVNAGYTTYAHWRDAQGTGLNVPWTFGEHTISTYFFSFNRYNNFQNTTNADQREVQAGTGVFIEEIGAKEYKAKIDRIPDGTSHTVILSENLQATNWYACNPPEVGFVVPIPNTNALPNHYDDSVLSPAHEGIGPDPNIGGKGKALCYDTPLALGLFDSAINANLGAAEGTSPRPSSNHPNVVNVFFADGHGGPIAQNIDAKVWFRLVSSAGERFGQPVLGDTEF